MNKQDTIKLKNMLETDEQFRNSIENAKDGTELSAILSNAGFEISEDQLIQLVNNIKSPACKNLHISDQELTQIAGGKGGLKGYIDECIRRGTVNR